MSSLFVWIVGVHWFLRCWLVCVSRLLCWCLVCHLWLRRWLLVSGSISGVSDLLTIRLMLNSVWVLWIDEICEELCDMGEVELEQDSPNKVDPEAVLI